MRNVPQVQEHQVPERQAQEPRVQEIEAPERPERATGTNNAASTIL